MPVDDLTKPEIPESNSHWRKATSNSEEQLFLEGPQGRGFEFGRAFRIFRELIQRLSFPPLRRPVHYSLRVSAFRRNIPITPITHSPANWERELPWLVGEARESRSGTRGPAR